MNSKSYRIRGVRTRTWRAFLVLALVALAGCARPVLVRGPSGETLSVPRDIAGSLEPVAPGDAAYTAADPKDATGTPGIGRVSTPSVVRLTRDLTVYRLWRGPAVRDAQGRTNRIGEWWAFDPPTGTLASYRRRYEVCEQWNTLRWVARCTLRRGSVVVMGPGQSVNAKTCDDPSGREEYPANERDLQVYIHEAWTRTGQPDSALSCPDESRDYQDDPQDVAKPLAPRSRN
jgi:hypothetical protein